MKKTLKRTLIALLCAGALLLACALVVSYLVMRSPEKVTAAAQVQIHQYFGMPVSIAETRLDLKKGPRVVLTSVRIESPGTLNLTIKRVYAYISVWRLFFGEVKVSRVRLWEPVATVYVENLKKLRPKEGAGKRPVLIVGNGSLNLLYKGKELPLSEVNGRIDSVRLDLRARTLGGRVLLEADLGKPGKATVEAYGIRIDQVDKNLQGVLRLSLSLENETAGASGSLSLEAKGLTLPWARRPIEKLTASLTLSGTQEHLDLTEIVLKTPLVTVSGKGLLSGAKTLSAWRDANVWLNLSSSDFDYEPMVSMLPVNRFPGWLKKLLTSEIRRGKSRFSLARYSGPVMGFFSGEELMKNLTLVQELKGQSFSHGRSPERVTGITGKVMYRAGDIELQNLSGIMGKSRVNRVNLIFHDVAKPFLKLTGNADLDMPAPDFLRTWRAAMAVEGAYALLSPVSGVKAGQVRARVSTQYDEASGKPPQLKGDIRLIGCTYSWGTHTVIGQTGTIRSDSFSSPLHIVMSSQMDSIRIRKLDMSLTEPFGKNRYRVTLLADRLSLSKLSLEDASLKITGRGEGPNLNGEFEIRTPGITILGTLYKPVSAPILVRGDLKAVLWPQSRFDLSGVDVRMTSGKLTGSARLEGDAGRATLTGLVRLAETVRQGAKGPQDLDGSVSGTMKLSWGKEFTVNGNLLLNEVTLALQEMTLAMNGPITVHNGTVSSSGLRVATGDTRMTLTGDLFIQDKPRFRGSVAVSGLKLGGDNASGLAIPKDLIADAPITLTDCAFSGVPIERAKATATLRDGVLDLTHVEVQALSGSAKGTISIAAGGNSSCDLAISIHNADMRKLIRSTTSSKSWIDGDLDLEGRIFGSIDSPDGSLALTVRNGEIRRYRLISQIFSLLNIYKIIRAGDIESLSSHFTYNRLSSTFTIRDGIISFDDLALDSNSLQLSAVGTYSMKTKNVDAVLGVQPLESVDKTVSMIPLLGWVLTGDKGKMIIVSMTVKGHIDDPTVQVAPITTISTAVTSTLLRTLRIPSHLIDESLKILKKKE
ncbi:MAG: AsmA-like C-terminal domain-containing protein [Deltaproteobacteria bacterium]|nr:AsmA-like C-terminal domain-containing protein [Deltaproteobacteria bacterium]